MPELLCLESFPGRIQVPGGSHAPISWTEAPALKPFNKPVNINDSLSSVSHYRKLSNLRRGLWEPSIVAKLGRSVGTLGTQYF